MLEGSMAWGLAQFQDLREGIFGNLRYSRETASVCGERVGAMMHKII